MCIHLCNRAPSSLTKTWLLVCLLWWIFDTHWQHCPHFVSSLSSRCDPRDLKVFPVRFKPKLPSVSGQCTFVWPPSLASHFSASLTFFKEYFLIGKLHMKPLFKVRFWEILPKTPFLVYRIYSLFKHCETNCSWLALNMLHWPGFFALLASSTRNISCLCWSLYTPNFISYMLALSFNLEFRSLLGPAPILSALNKLSFHPCKNV